MREKGNEQREKETERKKSEKREEEKKDVIHRNRFNILLYIEYIILYCFSAKCGQSNLDYDADTSFSLYTP